MRAIITLSCIIFIIFTASTVQAQFKEIAAGPSFEEPENGFAKILQMKNGNTAFVNITLQEGINLRIYDSVHTEKVNTTVSTAYGELGRFDVVEAVFEISNTIVIIISRLNDDIPTLTRLIIDGNTGKLKLQKNIGAMRDEWKSSFGNTNSPKYFIVRKDPSGDTYAIALLYSKRTLYSRKTDITSPLEIIHYGSDHNEVSRKLCAAPNDNEARCGLIDMVVAGPEKIIALFKIVKDRKVTNMLLGFIENGKLTYKEANLAIDRYLPYYSLKYNPVSNKIILLEASAVNEKRLEEYSTFLYMFNSSATKEDINDFGIGGKLQTGYQDFFDKKDPYQGMPQDLVVNEDGSFTILYEEILAVRNNTGNGTELGQTVVSTYDQYGKKISDYLLPKKHWIIGTMLLPFYVQSRELAAQELFKGNQYKSFVYLGSMKKQFILFNDTEKNNDLKGEKLVSVNGVMMRSKLTMVMGVTGDCDAFMYELTGNDIMPKREYLFGEKDKGHALALLPVSAYNKQNNMLVTIRLDKKTDRNKTISIVWLEIP